MRRYFFICLVFLCIPLVSVEARSGCCSHHSGVCGCGCCDGSSLSATCLPYYPECIRRPPTAIPTKRILPTATNTPMPTAQPTIAPTNTPMVTNTQQKTGGTSFSDFVTGLFTAGVSGGIGFLGLKWLVKKLA